MNIIVAGDFCPIDRTIPLIEEERYSEIFENVKPVIDSADYSIVNLECPIVSSPDAQPIQKCGPNLRCTQNALDAIKYAGFRCVTLANNHFQDYGTEGCVTTIRELEFKDLDYVGGGASLPVAQYIKYKKIGGKTLAIVNFCEHEFSIATDNLAGSAPLDLVDNYRQITEAREKADFVLVIIHGGNEHYQLPSPRMKKTYRWFVDLGADAVVNHHQHCFSGYEEYKGKPIFYGIGNFCFDNNNRRNTIWNEGFIVKLSFDSGAVKYKLYPIIQCNEHPSVRFLNVDARKRFDKDIDSLNRIIASDRGLQNNYECFCKELSTEWLFNLEPYKPNRLFAALYRRKLLPSFISKGKVKWLINFIECESQRPRLLATLYTRIKK